MGKPKDAGASQPAASPAESESKQRGKALWAAMQAAVDLQIAGDKNHGWGNKDSMAVIESLVAEDASLSKVGDVTKFTLSDEALRMIATLVNPSAFRQQLESDKRLNKSENKRTGSLKGLADEFGS